MIDKSLLVSPEAMWLYEVKRVFWLYCFPVLLGFMSVISMQIYVKVGQTKSVNPWFAFLCSASASMMTLYGWRLVTRTGPMIFFYGCGVGLAVMTMSRIGAIVAVSKLGVRLPRIIWKSNTAELQAIQRKAREAAMRAAALLVLAGVIHWVLHCPPRPEPAPECSTIFVCRS